MCECKSATIIWLAEHTEIYKIFSHYQSTILSVFLLISLSKKWNPILQSWACVVVKVPATCRLKLGLQKERVTKWCYIRGPLWFKCWPKRHTERDQSWFILGHLHFFWVSLVARLLKQNSSVHLQFLSLKQTDSTVRFYLNWTENEIHLSHRTVHSKNTLQTFIMKPKDPKQCLPHYLKSCFPYFDLTT